MAPWPMMHRFQLAGLGHWEVGWLRGCLLQSEADIWPSSREPNGGGAFGTGPRKSFHLPDQTGWAPRHNRSDTKLTILSSAESQRITPRRSP